MSSLTEQKPNSIETGDTLPLNPYHTQAKDSSKGVAKSEPLDKDVSSVLPSVASNPRPTDDHEEKKSDEPEPVQKVPRKLNYFAISKMKLVTQEEAVDRGGTDF